MGVGRSLLSTIRQSPSRSRGTPISASRADSTSRFSSFRSRPESRSTSSTGRCFVNSSKRASISSRCFYAMVSYGLGFYTMAAYTVACTLPVSTIHYPPFGSVVVWEGVMNCFSRMALFPDGGRSQYL
jgi:hypothetical protein